MELYIFAVESKRGVGINLENNFDICDGCRELGFVFTNDSCIKFYTDHSDMMDYGGNSCPRW